MAGIALFPGVPVVRMLSREDPKQQGPGGRDFPSSPHAGMFERGAKSWFYYCEAKTQTEKEKRNWGLSETSVSYKEKILREFCLGRVLQRLVCDGVFSLHEYRDILSQACYPKRVDCFLLKLFSKGAGAFCTFCSHLEEFCPYLLTCFFLYYQEQTLRLLQDAPTAEEKARLGTQPGLSRALDAEDQELSLQLCDKYVNILRVFAILKYYAFIFRFFIP
ncbi:uncharacterized protein LOC128573693 [Nycticebus coucang]|uniref:uncharacterized protein LOC128573693 n=2 Tax=Nycticebus coucang TaxID=9470 RepID=UPI00234CC3E9|nr:uncharacterized protein LOC128573693 [Nycticebus coucang]